LGALGVPRRWRVVADGTFHSYVELREFYPSVFADLPALDAYVDDLAHNVVFGLAPRDSGRETRKR